MGENVAIVTTWAPLQGAPFARSSLLAVATLVTYVGIVAAVATLSFLRRDVASVS